MATNQYDFDAGIPVGSGSSGSGIVPSSGSSSAPPNGTWGKAVQVVYGCATVQAVPLMMEDNGLGYVNLDGSTAVMMMLGLAQFGLAIGPVTSVDGVIYEKRLYGPSAIAGHQLVYDNMDNGTTVAITLGDVSTASEWSVLSARAVDYRVPFGHIALFRCEFLGCPSGRSPTPEMKAVVSGFFADRNNPTREAAAALDSNWTINDANPADVIKDLLENTRYGLGYPAGTVIVDVGADGTAASSYETYCDAYSLWIALGVDETVQVVDVIAQILMATNSIGFWEGNSFKVVPLGDLTKTANGVTYTPVATALAIDDDVLILNGESTVVVRRTPLRDTFNSVPVEWSEDTATREVVLATAEVPDAANVELTGMRRGDPVSLPCIRTLEHAQFVSRILAERNLYARDTWEFRVNPRAAALLQVGDMISLTHVAMGVADEILRIVETDEDERGELAIKAVKWLSTTEITVTELTPVDEGLPPTPRILFQLGTGTSAVYDDVSETGLDGYVYDGSDKDPGNTALLIGFRNKFQGVNAVASRISDYLNDPQGLWVAWSTTAGRSPSSETISRGNDGTALAWLSNTGGFSLLTGATPGPRITMESADFALYDFYETCWAANAPVEIRWTVPAGWTKGLGGLTLGTAFPSQSGDADLYWVLFQNQLTTLTYTRGESVNDSRKVTFTSLEVVPE